MKFLISVVVFAVAFAEEVKVKSVALPEPAAPFVRDGILRSLVPPVNVAEPDGQEISGDSIVQFANEAQEVSDPETAEVQDVPVEDRIQFADAPSPQVNAVKIGVPQVLGNQKEPVPEDLRFHLRNDLVNVERLAVPEMHTEYDAPNPEGLKVQFVDVPSQIEPVKINVPHDVDVQDSPVSDDLRVKFVDDQEWAVQEDLTFPFFHAIWPQVNSVVIGVPQPLDNQDASVPEDLRVKFVDTLLESVDSVKAGVEPVSENQDAPIFEDLKVRFADTQLPNVEPVRVSIPIVSEIPIESVPEDHRVQLDDEPWPVKNADLSKPGKVFPNPMWR